MRVAIGGSSYDWFNQGAGGVAYLGSFNWNSDTPTYVFTQQLAAGNEKYTAEAISHEVGHTLGLYHDGRTSPSEGYYSGHGSGETGWAPIMGVGYYQNLTQWSKGQYLSANNTEDDLAIITSQNGFGYKVDDTGSTLGTANPLTVSGTAVSANGIIERNSDVDFFSFTTGAGVISLAIAPSGRSPNLDILAELYNAAGTLVATSNPTDLLAASISATVSAGTYYLKVDGVGKGDPLGTGYTDYGSLGQYAITGTIISGNAPPTLAIAATNATQTEGNTGSKAFTFTVTRSGNTSGANTANWAVTGNGTNPANATDFANNTLPSGTVSFAAGETSKVITVNVQGDTTVEQNETFAVTLSNPTNGATLTTASATGTITNDDTPPTDQNLYFNVIINDSLNIYSAYHSLITTTLQASGRFWDDYIEGFDVDLDVIVNFNSSIPRATGRSVTSSFVRNNGTYNIFDQGAAAEIRTGVDPNGTAPDIEIEFNPNYLINELWFDSDPLLRTAPVPTNRTDAVSVFMHELGHAFAFNGWMNNTTGTMPGNYQSPFDEKINFVNGNFFFSGSQAVEIYGSPVPLTYGNIHHLGNSSPRPGSDLIPDLMNGVVFNRGTRYYISPLDVAIFADTGLPMI